MQMYNSLTQYHSIPSSVMFSRLLADEDTQSRDSDAFTHVDDSEFAQFLDDHLCSMPNPHFGSKPSPSTDFHSTPPFTADKTRACLPDNNIEPQLHREREGLAIQQQPPCMTNGCSRSVTDTSTGPGLSSISELGADESNKFCSFHAHIKMGNASHGNLWPGKPPNMPIPNDTRLAPVKNQLMRHNSSPADVLSRLIMDEGSGETVLHFGDLSKQNLQNGSMANHVGTAASLLPAQIISTFDQANCISKTEDGKGVTVEARSVRSPSLLRQNSSPAGLLSQISFGGMSASTCTKLSSSALSDNSSEEQRRGGGYEAARFWDEIGFDEAGLVHRKRGREGHSMHRLQSCEISFTNQNDPHAGSTHATMSGDGPVGMEVLCRVSAKRGCATHPRSIAERVRRTKINEGIRKLQELMPNMEKQTNTVAMLDEVVEYVKFLQRQVQELSESRPKCDGRCKVKGTA